MSHETVSSFSENYGLFSPRSLNRIRDFSRNFRAWSSLSRPTGFGPWISDPCFCL